MARQHPAGSVSATVAALVDLAGAKIWAARQQDLRAEIARSPRVGRALAQRHAIELVLEKLRQGAAPSPGEARVVALAETLVQAAADLPAAGRARLRAALRAALAGPDSLIPLFHLARTAALQQARGFAVQFAGLAEEAPFDLLIRRNGAEAEIACDVVSAEEGRDVQRSSWVRLIDAIDPDLQRWLADHPGRYLLKLTLPQGLRGEAGGLAALHRRIHAMLAESRRADQDEAAVLRLDPLMLAAAQLGESGAGGPDGTGQDGMAPDRVGLVSSLRREFGHQAHLAVMARGPGVFVLAARAGREDEVAAAIRRRLAALAPARLSGTRPGILAMFVEDTDRAEWRHLRERLELEGEARQFLTHPAARGVVAVTCASRLELFGAGAPDAAPDGEWRFRNPAHPAAKAAGLAPAVLSSM